MWGVFVLLFVFIILVNMVLMKRTYAEEKHIFVSELLKMEVFNLFSIMMNIVCLRTSIRATAFIALNLLYIFFFWFMYFNLRFVKKYVERPVKKCFKSVSFWIAVVSTLLIVGNIFTRFFFSATHMEWFSHTYWAVYGYLPFYILLGFYLLEALYMIFMLAAEAFHTARVYRLKYWSVAFVVIINIVFSICKLIFDYPDFFLSMLICALCALMVYMAVFYSKSRLVYSGLLFVADKLNDGIVLYDEKHHLQFVTDSFLEAFSLPDSSHIQDELSYWSDMSQFDKNENGIVASQREIYQNGVKHYYDVKCKVLEEGDFKVGTVYWIQDVTPVIESFVEIERKANYDDLTGIYNERHFSEKVKEQLSEVADIEYVLICLDIERFRLFEEHFGREMGEKLLKAIGTYIDNSYNTWKNVIYGRLDTDMFCILMPFGQFYEEDLIEGVEKIVRPFDAPFYNVRVLIGAYKVTDPSVEVRAMVNRVLMASASIKNDYSAKIGWFDEKIQSDTMEEARFNAELSDAIKNGQIQMYLQPQVDRDGKVIGSEALVRWIHPTEGVISPARFIPSFESSGRITELDMCIWEQACEKLREWKKMGRDDIYISVNISARDLYSVDIYKIYTSLIEEYGIESKNLKLEITESAIIGDLKQHVDLVEHLQGAGFAVEMDDFGSAYSSFNMLKDVCVDVLKIDMKFLGNTKNVERSQTILTSIVSLAKALNMFTVAEGVETKEQADFLRDAGCDVFQGYYFSKPVSVKEFEEKYL